MCILSRCKNKNGVPKAETSQEVLRDPEELLKKKASFGVTLIETLFSALILALVVACVLVIFVRTVDMSKRIDKEYVATNLAKSRLERARSAEVSHGFSSLVDLDETDTMIDIDEPPDGVDDFKRSTTVTANHNGDARLTKIEVTVVYRYQEVWKDSIPVVLTMVLTDLD